MLLILEFSEDVAWLRGERYRITESTEAVAQRWMKEGGVLGRCSRDFAAGHPSRGPEVMHPSS